MRLQGGGAQLDPGGPTVKFARYSSVTLATAAVAWSLLAAAPANAQTRVFHDATGDTNAPSDITRVVVDNATTSNRIVVRARMGNMAVGDSATLWLDTRPTNPGPEYKVRVYPDSDGFSLRRVASFTDNGQAVPCGGMRLSAVPGGDVTDSFSIPRGCLNNPGKVRATVRGRYLYASRVVVDWAPSYHRFFGWVGRG